MIKFKKLAIISIVSIASIQNSYSMSYLYEMYDYAKSWCPRPVDEYVAQHQYGLLDSSKANPDIVATVQSHPAMQRGANFLVSLNNDQNLGITASAVKNLTTDTNLPSSYDMRINIMN